MNMTELVNKVAAETGVTNQAANAAVKAVLEGISDALETGEKVQLIGFGSFKISTREGRTAKNPRTKELIKVSGYKTINFKAGKNLKERIHGVNKSR